MSFRTLFSGQLSYNQSKKSEENAGQESIQIYESSQYKC